MTAHAVHCKMCKKPFSVEVADDYAALGDQFKLLPMACCNRCYDYVTGKRNVTKRIFEVCHELQLARISIRPDKRADKEKLFSETLAILTKKFGVIVSEYYNCNYFWGPEFVDQLFEFPDRAGTILNNYMTTYKRCVVDPQPEAA
jgi:hypothetical protein